VDLTNHHHLAPKLELYFFSPSVQTAVQDASEMLCIFLNLDDGKVQKEEILSVVFNLYSKAGIDKYS
jgi:hypothetical protein